MTVAAVLVIYALSAAFGAPVLLRRGRWAQRSPRLGITAWMAWCSSVILALGLAGLALAVPSGAVSGGLSEWLRTCVMALRAEYATPGGTILAATGTAFALFIAGRSTLAVSAAWLNAWRGRNVHRRAVALTGRRQPGIDALVVDCDQAAAYCMPGRHGQIVLTTAALAALDGSELAAVLAHERAHLRGRHHLIVGAAQGLASAFPGVSLFQTTRHEVATLVEMLADDAAARHHHRATIATAMVVLAGMRSPQAALAASGSATLARVQRLPGRPLRFRLRRWRSVRSRSSPRWPCPCRSRSPRRCTPRS